MKRTTVVLAGIFIGVFVMLLALPATIRLLTDWYWFDALGYSQVFTRQIVTRVLVGTVAAACAFVFFFINFRLAQRGVVPDPIVVNINAKTPRLDITRGLQVLALPGALILGVLVGLTASGSWLMLLRFFNATPFGEVDPIFGRDVGYYVFQLPAVEAITSFVQGLTILALFIVLPLYLMRGDIVFLRNRATIEPSAQVHVGILVALLFLVAAVQTFLVRIPSLVYSNTGPLFGASYADLAGRLPMLRIAGVLAGLGALLVLWGAWRKNLVRQLAIALVVYFGFVALGTGVYPAALQRLVVVPNELAREAPQLADHIDATRRAWGLADVQTRSLSGVGALTLEDIRNSSGTIENVRLWDRDPLLETFGQLQEIRTYYDFVSVDDDRYWIDGRYRQVLLSPRELNTASLPTRTFINERLTFTHGMGLTLSPVNQVTPEGLPTLFIKDLPPQSDVSLRITRPGIYYGELSSDFVFVNTGQDEFDYPSADSSAVTQYSGVGGVPVGGLLRKLLYSARFQSLKILLSADIDADSRVLYYRDIMERARRALPFILFDGDPYMVITEDGLLKWMLDGYTVSNRYPYSEPLNSGVNYMRNSVKVVLDAYDGTVETYIADPEDPLIRTYGEIFPSLMRPMEDMPADLRAHVRYPEDLFRIQSELYTIYHMDQPDVFYHREDQWQIPTATTGESTTRDPFLRHIIMRLPDEPQEEFIVMTPFTPRQRNNLAAWMVARNDGEHYGELVVYSFPRQSLVFGPSQIANRINQDTEIARQISLWDQRGSQVIRGNLLVIPIQEAIIYVQAIYLRAEGGQGRIPELRRVVVAYQNEVVMEETLDLGLARLFGGNVDPRTSPDAVPTRETTATETAALPGALRALLQQASESYNRALEAQRAGDWATYGREIQRVGDLLRQLRQGNGASN
jgi:uncharacterized membrane protein (UPF0182 family)